MIRFFIDKKHSAEWHISEFEKMAEILAGYTKTCVISFIDIYKRWNAISQKQNRYGQKTGL